MPDFAAEIRKIVKESAGKESAKKRILERLEVGNYTREEDSASHFSVYFLPYNPKTGEVFIVDHKKSSLWLFPGGHVDKGELPLQTAIREIGEELGIQNIA